MRFRHWVVIVSLVVVAAGVFGSTTHLRNTQTPPLSLARLVKQQATKDIQKQQSVDGKISQNIKVIQIASEGGTSFAFATFSVDRHRQYSSLIMESKGYVMSTFTLSTSKQAPIHYSTLRRDGFEYITGEVFNPQGISSVVITWTNGATKTVAVQNGYFGYEHKIQLPSDPHVKQVVGVTKAGDVIH